MLVLCCSSCCVDCQLINPSGLFFLAMNASFWKGPWAVLLITKVEQQALIWVCVDDIICT